MKNWCGIAEIRFRACTGYLDLESRFGPVPGVGAGGNFLKVSNTKNFPAAQKVSNEQKAAQPADRRRSKLLTFS